MTTDFDNPFAIIARHQTSVPIDVELLATDLGLKVYHADLGDDIYGKLTRDASKGGWSKYAVFVNKTNHPNRQRFTLAHEIAHFVLHRDLIEDGIIDDTQYRSTLSSDHETQANKLAADILMPRALVRAEFQRNRAIAPLAVRFQVSEAAMKIRLESLRLGA